MRGIADQVDPAVVHRRDDADTQVEQVALDQRTLRELRLAIGVQPLLQLGPDAIIGPVLDRVAARESRACSGSCAARAASGQRTRGGEARTTSVASTAPRRRSAQASETGDAARSPTRRRSRRRARCARRRTQRRTGTVRGPPLRQARATAETVARRSSCSTPVTRIPNHSCPSSACSHCAQLATSSCCA